MHEHYKCRLPFCLILITGQYECKTRISICWHDTDLLDTISFIFFFSNQTNGGGGGDGSHGNPSDDYLTVVF